MADSETLRTHGTVHCSDRDAIPRGLSLSQHTLRTCPNAIRAAAVAQFHLSNDLSTHCLRTLNGAGTR